MSIVYQYDANAYFVAQCDDYGGSLPHNCTAVKPVLQEGFIPLWTGSKWEQVENHKGLEGYLNGEPYTIKDYGPLPEGFSTTKPLPSLEEAKHEKQSEVINKFSAMFAPINAVYPPEEQTSWPEQEKEAALYIAWEQAGKQGKAPETPCLCAILMPGESLEALCQSVMQKGPLFRALRNTLQAQQRVHFHTVAALESSEDVMAYKVEYILPPELEAYLGGQ